MYFLGIPPNRIFFFLQDPQSLKPSATPPPLPSAMGEGGADSKLEENPFAIARPHAKVDPLSLSSSVMFQRQTSFKGFNELQVHSSVIIKMRLMNSNYTNVIILQAQQGNSPFKRQFSLRLAELPSTLERQKMSAATDQTSSSLLADDPVLAKLGLDEDPAAQQPPTLKSTPNSGTGVVKHFRTKVHCTVFPFTLH